MQWWAWIILGSALLAIELTFIDAQFFLVFLGVSGLIVGLLAFVGATESAPAQWIAFAVIALVSMVGFRRRLFEKLRGNLPGFDATVVGEQLVLKQRLGPGEECRAELRGTTWTVRNVDDRAIEQDAPVRVEEADGLLLKVRRVR